MKYLFLLLLLCTPALAYYADITVSVDEAGKVDIRGITDHPDLEIYNPQAFTSKDKEYWLLNISIEDEFSDYIYEVKLPKDSKINYIKVPNLLSLSEDSGRMVITGTGKDEPLDVLVQYKIVETNFSYVLILIILCLSILVYFLVKYINLKPSVNTEALTSRQKLIVDTIRKNKGSIIQSKLQKFTKIPKGSLARNIKTLESKGFVVKQQKGITNLITIKK